MSEASVSENSDPLKAVADAMEAAVEAAKEGATEAREAAGNALPVASGLLAKFAYNACYSISYGVVFPTVLVARSVPQDNALVHGLVDGARAALDMVDEMKKGEAPAPSGSLSPPEQEPGAA
jgi:hypothetical protein